MTSRIITVYRVIVAIRKHVVPEEALARAAVGIGIEEALHGGVVISALQIVEPGFGIVVVAPVAQGVQVSIIHIPAAATLDGGDVAPCVVAVLCINCFALVDDLHHVALRVQHVMEGVGSCQRGIVVAAHGKGAACLVVDEIVAADKGVSSGIGHVVPDDPAVLGHVLVLQAVRDLHAPHAGHVVLVAVGLIALFQAAQSPALRPGQVGVFPTVVLSVILSEAKNPFLCRGSYFLFVQKGCKDTTGEGEDSESLPPPRSPSPNSNGQKGVPFWISPSVILSAAKNPYPWYDKKNARE